MATTSLGARSSSTCRQICRSEKSFKLRNPFLIQNHRERYHARRNALFSSHAAYQDPTLAWAQANPQLAQECLNPPPLKRVNDAVAPQMMGSFEAYLEWRGWEFPEQVNDVKDSRENAKALVSHLLSAPLTLASQFGKLKQHSTSNNNKNGNLDLDWCCIGARAEASIPLMYWKEFLISSRASLSLNDLQLASSSTIPWNKDIGISLDFVGPDIPPKLLEQSVIIPEGQDERESNSTSISLRGYHRGFFHESPTKAMKSNGNAWDAYIFYNPGFGHPNLLKSWEPTLKLILGGGQENTRSVLLLTAHSEHDMARDASILKNTYGLSDIIYHENPFASRIKYEDPFEKNHFVRPNHYVATVVI